MFKRVKSVFKKDKEGKEKKPKEPKPPKEPKEKRGFLRRRRTDRVAGAEVLPRCVTPVSNHALQLSLFSNSPR
jgi:hypothetical protein